MLLGESLPLRPSQVSADPIERGAPQAVPKLNNMTAMRIAEGSRLAHLAGVSRS